MSRLETKFRLMREFGSVLDPVQRLLYDTNEPNPSKIRTSIAIAQLVKDWVDYSGRVHAFCTVNGLLLQPFYQKICDSMMEIFTLLKGESIEIIKREFPKLHRKAEAALLEIPADDPDLMLPPQSPFRTYLRLIAICGGTSTRLQLFDPYLDAEVFDRYLPDVGDGVEITLVTDVGNMRNARRRGRIIAISELVSLERPTHYSLESLHNKGSSL